MGSLSHFLCPFPLQKKKKELSFEDVQIFKQDPAEFPPRWIFIVGGCQLSSLHSLHMLAMFLFERTADVQKGPFCFPVCWMGVWGVVGSGGSNRKEMGRGLRV